MATDPLAPRSSATVALDLSGFSFSSVPELGDVPNFAEDSLTEVHGLLEAGECASAVSRLAALRAEPSLWVKPEIRALLLGLEGSAKLGVGAADAGENDLLHALADAKSARRLISPLGVSLLNNLSVLSFVFHNRAPAAENQLRQAISFIPDRMVDRFNQRPICFRNLGIVQDARGDQNEAVRSLRQALYETTRGPLATLELIEILAKNRERADDSFAVEALRVAAFSIMERSRHDCPEAFIAAARDLSLLLLKNGELERLGPIVQAQIDVMNRTLTAPTQWRLTPAILLLALHHAEGARWAKAYAMLDWALDLEKHAPPDVAGPIEFLRGVSAFYRKEALHRQANLAREVYRIAVAKRSKRE